MKHYNIITDELRGCNGLDTFKKKLKTLLLQKYYCISLLLYFVSYYLYVYDFTLYVRALYYVVTPLIEIYLPDTAV